MKKSTNESPAETPEKKPYKVPLLWEIASGEGGFSLVIVFPLVVLYILKMAYR
ncbi:MAG: hypothetical protein H7301_05930 [Cryobacterium sp.]|nr:hypothetical protein [Oligoflexia bacterium]